MSLIFNGTEMDTVIFNGINMDTVIINGVEVFTAKLSHFYHYQYNPQWNSKISKSISGFSSTPLASTCLPGGGTSIAFTFKKTSKLEAINAYCYVDATADQSLGDCLVQGAITLICNGRSSSQSDIGGVQWGGTGNGSDNILRPWTWTGTLSINVSDFTNDQTYTGYIYHSCSGYSGNYASGAAASGCKVYSIMPVYA